MPTGLENLKIYQMARQLELRVFELTKKFPKDEFFRSIDQVRRSSSSITNNIAEAYNKQSIKEKIRIFNDIAKGEANETRANLEMTLRKGFHKDQILIDDYTQLIKGISGFVNFLRGSDQNPKLKNLKTSKLRPVLAVDPGFDRIGLAIMKLEENKPKLLFSECFKTDSKKARPERLLSIGKRIKSAIQKWQPEALAIETLFFNTNITSAIGVAEARGIIIYESAEAGLEIFEYSPQAIKIAVTGYGKADKIQMETMVKKLANLPAKSSKRLDDEVDAIALGITYIVSHRNIN